VNQLFRLLFALASQKNQFAGVLYKTLTFLFIENYSSPNLRDLFLRNFQSLTSSQPTIPTQVLLEPFVKMLDLNLFQIDATLNLSDLEFLQEVVQHDSVGLALALDLTNVLRRIYIQTCLWAKQLFNPIAYLVFRFIEYDDYQLYLITMVSSLLVVFKDLFLKKISPLQKSFNFETDVSSPQELEVQACQKQAEIVELIKFIININVLNVNQVLKPILIKAYLLQQASLHARHSGLLSLLRLFGDPQALLQRFSAALKNGVFDDTLLGEDQ